ncbi:MAG TPA: PQQ-binding-like beta-propeller repeat protein [Gemmataceae bacterium]|nr:PQQ-binding-like beta-propeller repeat protein [Gemmataceae bacterium]
MPYSLIALMLAAVPLAAADWPHWRGPARDGRTDEPSRWADGRWLPDQPAWTANVGSGASSPLVIGDRVYCLGRTGGRDVIRCLSTKDGKELWSAGYRGPEYGRFHNGDEGLYSGPSSTPEYDPETKLLYTLGPDGDLRCWDTAADSKEVWTINLYDTYKVKQRPKLTRAPLRDYGYTSSPLVHGSWLLVEVGSTRGSLVAFDKKSGKEVWTSELTDEAGHNAGPVLMTVEGVPCVALLTQRNLAIIRLDAGNEGKTVATYPWVTDFANNIASPAVRDNFVLITAAYNQNAICKLKVTLAGIEKVWQKPYPSKVCTPVIHGNHIYYAWQKVRCLNWETGEQLWEGGSFSDPGSCIMTADDRLVVYGGNGKLALVESAQRSPKSYTELAVKDRLFKSQAWPHVVIAGGRVYCRDREGNLVCFEVGK